MAQFVIEVPTLPDMEARLIAAPATIRTTLDAAVEAAAIAMQTIVKTEVPVRTGRLRKSISFEASGGQAVIFPDLKVAPYAIYVHEGTGIFGTGYGAKKQPIRPINAKVLATKVNPGWGSKNAKGYFIIGKYSIGQRPNPFMKYAYQRGKVKVLTIMSAAVKSVIEEL